MVLTDKQIDEFIARNPTPPLVRVKKPEPAPVLKVATNRKLSLEGQRERTANEVKELVVAERDAPQKTGETPEEKRKRLREEGLYYRGLYEAAATAEYYSKQRDIDHGNYSPIALYEQQVRRGQ
jgi:hypothetical protein